MSASHTRRRRASNTERHHDAPPRASATHVLATSGPRDSLPRSPGQPHSLGTAGVLPGPGAGRQDFLIPRRHGRSPVLVPVRRQVPRGAAHLAAPALPPVQVMEGEVTYRSLSQAMSFLRETRWPKARVRRRRRSVISRQVSPTVTLTLRHSGYVSSRRIIPTSSGRPVRRAPRAIA
jgi:hypothetical protein